MTKDFDTASIVSHLNDLISLQQARLRNDRWPRGQRKPADDTRDWLAINFLFRVGREYGSLSAPARQQLDVIFQGWTSSEPLTLEEFTSMLELLRNLILTSAEEWTGPIHASGSVEAPAGSWFPV